MNAEVLRIVGQVAGIGGLAFGVFLLLFREIIRKTIFPMLTKEQGYKFLRMIAVLVFTLALAGILAWVYIESHRIKVSTGGESAAHSADCRDTQPVSVEVSVLGEDTRSWPGDENTVLRYFLERTQDCLRIQNSLGCRDAFNAGGPIAPLKYIPSPTRCAFRWSFPSLDFKLVNNGRSTVFLSEVLFDVEESRPDRTPLFSIVEDSQRRHAGLLRLINEGWCDLADLTFSFHLLPGEFVPPPNYAAPYRHSITLPVLADTADINVTKAFHDEGADIDGLNFLYDVKSESPGVLVVARPDGSQEKIGTKEWEDRFKKCLGPFQKSAGTLAGEVSFVSAEDRSHRHQVHFYAVVYLEDLGRLGLPKPPTYTYDAVFNAQNTAYQRRVQISHEIKPGETDRFTVKIGVPQSSFHRFHATIRDISGLTLESLPIEMNCFVPRYRRDAVASAIARSSSR